MADSESIASSTKGMEFEVELDGSQGEGGGQILRTAVSMAAILRKSLRICNIRAGRPKPGLAAQHLTGINLIAEISEGSTLSGNEMKSTELSFVPGNIDGKDQKSYAADPHTAGSVTLMVQIALPCLLWSVVGGEGVRELELGGGTNVMASPPIEHLYFVLLPLLEGMIMVDEAGAGGSALTCEVHRTGWFPRGGGKVRLKVQGFKDLMPLVLTSREADETPSSVQVFVSSQIPESEWNGGVMDSLKCKLQSSMEELASSAIGAGEKVPEERDSPPNLEIVVNPFGNNSPSALVGNRNHPSDHAKKRHRKEAGGGGGIPSKQRVFALTIVVRYRSGTVLYTNLEDLTTLEWSAASERQVEAAFAEIGSMMLSNACLDERTADQVVIYNALALLRQRERGGDGNKKWEAALLVAPPNSRSSSLHLETVKDVIVRLIEGMSITINARKDGCREITMVLSNV